MKNYKTFSDDPYGVRLYTLSNGLQVYLAQQDDMPKIQTYIAVRVGSNNDPVDNTGLAHYLEHMFFKGTSKIGSTNWGKEEPLLKQIEQFFEEHRQTQSAEEKSRIYAEIDALSVEASKFAIPGEYDALMSNIGATNTNAHTWHDETIYKNTIPNTELERWLKIEYERFTDPQLRLFHTELESVYEEFNRLQDNDGRMAYVRMMETLFPTHPIGQQTTIGRPEHLKNPSMRLLHEHIQTWYVPNNMAIVLVGDLDFDKTIALVDAYFGKMQPKKLPKVNLPKEKPLSAPIRTKMVSPSAERIQIAWRLPGYGHQDTRIAYLVSQLLSNSGECGHIDIELNQRQSVLGAAAFVASFKDYSFFSINVIPLENQSLDEAKNLALEQIHRIAKGDFQPWMLEAIIRDIEIQRLKAMETADGLATSIYETFIRRRDWSEELKEVEKYRQITPDEISNFVSENLRENNLVELYKLQGTNEELIRVDKPKISEITLNQGIRSAFFEEIHQMPVTETTPVFVDYEKNIQQHKLGERILYTVPSRQPKLGEIHLLYPMGSDHLRRMPLCMDLLQFFGTEDYNEVEIREEFYRLGISYSFNIAGDSAIFSLVGLDSQLPEAVELFRHWLEKVTPNTELYLSTINAILESRELAKKNKDKIMAHLLAYARVGPNSRSRDQISRTEFEQLTPEQITTEIQQLLDYPYDIFYYGKNLSSIEKILRKYIPEPSLSIPKSKEYPTPPTERNVYLVDFDMVQVEMSKIARGYPVSVENFAMISLYNEYFGRGLSSIIFQEIREKRSLAYQAFVSYSPAKRLDFPDYIHTYIGTQASKLGQAVYALEDLLDSFPKLPESFENARQQCLSRIATERILKKKLFFNWWELRRLGIHHDLRKDIYQRLQTITLEDLEAFWATYIQPLDYNVAVLGKKSDLDLKEFEKLGNLQELTIDEIFGY